MGDINTKIQLKTSKIMTIQMTGSEFFNNQFCQGNLLISCSESLHIKSLLITIEKKQKWHYIEEVYNETKKKYDEISHFDEENRTILPYQLNITVGTVLYPGAWNIPFTFQLNGLTPSFEYEDSLNYCYNRYLLIAKLIYDVKGTETVEEVEQFLFIKSRLLPLNTPISSENKKKIKKWGLFGKGQSELKLKISKNYYDFYEKIPLEVEVENKKGKMDIDSVKFDIKRIIFFKTEKTKEISKNIIQIEKKIKIKSGENKKFDYNLELKEDKFKSIGKKQFDANILQPSFEDSLFKCYYFIKATAYFESKTFEGSRPRCLLDIAYSHKDENIGFNYNLCFDPNYTTINLQNYNLIPQQMQNQTNQPILVQQIPQIPQNLQSQNQQPIIPQNPQYQLQQPLSSQNQQPHTLQHNTQYPQYLQYGVQQPLIQQNFQQQPNQQYQLQQQPIEQNQLLNFQQQTIQQNPQQQYIPQNLQYQIQQQPIQQNSLPQFQQQPIQNNLQLQQNITNNEKEIFDKNTNCFNNSSIKNKQSNDIINYPSFNDI